MGGIESQVLDKPDWTEEEVVEEVTRALSEINCKNSFIPCLTAGSDDSGYPGVYAAVSREIQKISEKSFD